MKIAICGSMTFSPEMVEVSRRLRGLGHIFMYNPIPDMNYRDEIEAMQPEVLEGELMRI